MKNMNGGNPMPTKKKSNKFSDGERKTKREDDSMPKKENGKLTEDFQESLSEDMRGPMEGMEAIPPKINRDKENK